MKKNESSNTRPCPKCGNPMKMMGYTHIQRVGNLVVKDGTCMQRRCPSCDVVDMPLDDLRGYEIRAARTVLHDAKDRVDGPALRSIRKTLGLTQKQLGEILQYEHTYLSKLENSTGMAIPRTAQLALLHLLDIAERDGIGPDELMKLVKKADLGSSSELEVPAPRARKTG